MPREVLDKNLFNLTLRRLSYQLIEKFSGKENWSIIGIQPRGIYLASRIKEILNEEDPNLKFDFGILDITFYRDDFRRRETPITAHTTSIDFQTEGKHVVLIDDVLYSGRTIHAAMTALNHFGRPSAIELMVLVNRRFNRHIPIQPDYSGIQVDAVDEDYVRVNWDDSGVEKNVQLFLPNKDI